MRIPLSLTTLFLFALGTVLHQVNALSSVVMRLASPLGFGLASVKVTLDSFIQLWRLVVT